MLKVWQPEQAHSSYLTLFQVRNSPTPRGTFSSSLQRWGRVFQGVLAAVTKIQILVRRLAMCNILITTIAPLAATM